MKLNRVLSLLLSLVLILSATVPGTFALEVGDETTAPTETTVATEAPTEPPETTVATEAPTEPPETTVATEAPTEPPETTVATEAPAEPPETTVATEAPTEPPETTVATEAPTEPPETTVATEAPTEPPETTAATEAPTEPPETTEATVPETTEEVVELAERTITADADDGTTFEIKGKLPEDVTVSVQALKADYVAFIREQILKEEEPPEFIESAAYDVTLQLNGEEYEPEETVEVTVKGLDTTSGSQVWVRHLVDTSTEDLENLMLQSQEGIGSFFSSLLMSTEEELRVEDIVTETIEAIAGNGSLRFDAPGFSIYIVDNANERTGTLVDNDDNIPMTVGDADRYFYFDRSTDWYQEGKKWYDEYKSSNWEVTDPDGAIEYEVGTDGNFNANGIWSFRVPWITVTAVKPGTATLTANYITNNNTQYSQSFTITVTDPADFHIDDTVAENGLLVPSFVTDKTVGTENYTYEWTRSDGKAVNASALSGAAVSVAGGVNVSVDAGGQMEGKEPITYTVTAKDGDTVVATASYKVLYSQEILNSDFESPNISTDLAGGSQGNAALPNGYPGLYWQTTAPGTGSKLGLDVEVIRGNITTYGPSAVASGSQCVELNAEAFGALYQDILTTPGATLNWSFSHAARTTDGSNNTMYVVLAATESAQKIVDADTIDAMLTAAGATSMQSGGNKSFTYDGTTYYIWKHTANSTTWETISGSITVPDGQYLTRLFFVSDTTGDAKGATLGNLIDAAYAGQTLDYQIEYYLDGVLQGNSTQSGTEIVNSYVALRNLQTFLNQGYVVTGTKIGLGASGETGDIDYPGDAQTNGLYITNYGDSDVNGKDVVLKVYLKKQAIVVTKVVEIDGWDAMTDAQKTAIIGNGLTSTFALKQGEITTDYTVSLTITQADASGRLTAMGDLTNASGDVPEFGTYTIVETTAPEISGYSCTATFSPSESVTISSGSPNASVTCTNRYEASSGDLTITKKVDDDDIALDPGQTFIFHVTGPDGFSMDVVIAGNGSKTIKDLPLGRYTVTEDTSWSWRYTTSPESQAVTLTADGAEVTFTNTREDEKWLDDNSHAQNIFKADGSIERK